MAGAVADSVTGWLDLIWICIMYPILPIAMRYHITTNMHARHQSATKQQRVGPELSHKRHAKHTPRTTTMRKDEMMEKKKKRKSEHCRRRNENIINVLMSDANYDGLASQEQLLQCVRVWWRWADFIDYYLAYMIIELWAVADTVHVTKIRGKSWDRTIGLKSALNFSNRSKQFIECVKCEWRDDAMWFFTLVCHFALMA